MKKAINKLISWLTGLTKEDTVDLNKNCESIMLLFNESNFIKLSTNDRMQLLKMVTRKVRSKLTEEKEIKQAEIRDILNFEKEPYISKHKEVAKRNYDFLAMHNMEFLRHEN